MEISTIYTDLPKLYDIIYGGDSSESLVFLKWLADYLGIDQSQSLLDVGAGTGRLLIPLTKEGYDVSGIEPFKGMIDIAMQRAKLENIDISLVQGSFQELDEINAYDLVFSVNGAMNYIHSIDELRLSFSNVYRALKHGGYFLLDVMNFVAIIKRYKHPEVQEFHLDDMTIFSIVKHEIDLVQSIWVHTSHLFIQREDTWQKIEDVHRLSMITKRELEIHAQDTGFEFVRFFSSYQDREELFHNGARLIMLFRKPTQRKNQLS